MNTSTHAQQSSGRPTESMKPEAPDILEYGAPREGVKQSTNRRLFMQLLVYTEAMDVSRLSQAMAKSGVEGVLYLDVNDPRGIGVLLVSENPADFTGEARKLLSQKPFSQLKPRPEMTMMGRTYSIGHEQDLEDWLLKKPRRNLYESKSDWAVWYPLRRKGEFEGLSKEEQRPILMEHAKLGMGYGMADLAHDVRLACHGLDAADNEFVIGVLAKDLHPISRLIQDMRHTQQTSKYIQSMGPFFVGKVLSNFPKK